MVGATVQQLGRLDVMVANAGIASADSIIRGEQSALRPTWPPDMIGTLSQSVTGKFSLESSASKGVRSSQNNTPDFHEAIGSMLLNDFRPSPAPCWHSEEINAASPHAAG